MKKVDKRKEELKEILGEPVTKEVREKFRNYETVKTWLTAIKSDSSTVPDDEDYESGTELHYMGYFIKFTWWLKKDPDRIIAERIKDTKSSDVRVRRRYEKLVLEFSLGYKMQKKMRAASEARVAIKSFFYHNGVPLFIKSGKKTNRNMPKTLTIEEVRRILEFCDAREKALVLVLLQSGMRPKTLVLLTYGHIKNDFEAGVNPVRIDLSISEVKGGYAPYTAFIGKEACEALRNYLDYRCRGTKKIPPEIITENSPLFRKIDSVAPITCGEVRQIIDKVCRTAGIKKHVTPYTFRRTCQTRMEYAGVAGNWVDRLMGHIPRGAQGAAYSGPGELLREAYLKAEPFISVSEPVQTASEKNVKREVARFVLKIIGVDLDEILKKRRIKSLDEMTEEDIESLHEDFIRVWQLLSASRPRPESEKGSNTDDCTDNFSSTNPVCPNRNSLGCKENGNHVNDFKPYEAKIVTNKDELVELLEDGWDLIKEFSSEEYVVRRKERR